MTSLAIMGLLPAIARVEAGSIQLHGDELLTKSQRELRKLRGRELGIIMQDPMTALDPCFTIRSQLSEPLRQHRQLRGQALQSELILSLQQVQLSAARERLEQYPHQLSGGMRQRVTSAISLAGQPSILIADEPSTALDVTTQARYLQLLRDLQQARGFGLLLIAHDLLIVKHVCQRVVVMYSSEIVETGTTDQVFDAPKHPYTRALLGAIPTLDDDVQLQAIEGQAPEISEDVTGCRFSARCNHRREICSASPPSLTERGPANLTRCWGTEADGWLSD
jgi:oligopeptide/dipeptide ABC transporter ATP-binding protein